MPIRKSGTNFCLHYYLLFVLHHHRQLESYLLYLLYGLEPVLPMEVPLKPQNKVPASIATYRTQLVQKLELTHQVAKEHIQLSQQKMNELYL